MRRLKRCGLDVPFILLLVLGLYPVCMNSQSVTVQSKTLVGEGWHPWYEIKGDPENSSNMIICGTKWDPQRNALLGFVYASEDAGATWRPVLEDRRSLWVTEQSCTFGRKHTAYFISEASKVIDGTPHHEEGTTQLFVSTDAGQNWAKAAKTGWADYSTSAVSSTSGRLYVFYNSWFTTHKPGESTGGTLGLLIFSPDGKTVAGPFFDPSMQNRDYHGVFPTDSVSLRTGGVVSLYATKRETADGWQEDLGVVRADKSTDPALASVVVAHPSMDTNCFTVSDASLAYNPQTNRLYLVYVDGCRDKGRSQILLTSSEDEGSTWSKSVAIISAKSADSRVYAPTVVTLKGMLGLLWQEGRDRRSGRWLFSHFHDSRTSGPTVELSIPSDRYEVRDESLLTAVNRTRDFEPNSSSSMTLTVLSELNSVWRGHGLIVSGDKVIAIWPSEDAEGQQLNSGALVPAALSSDETTPVNKTAATHNVDRETMILFGGTQHFDSSTGKLGICLTLANRGQNALKVPISLVTRGIRSPVGPVSILNASNGLGGEGATWDISPFVTGDRIAPGSTSNPFCLSFHLDPNVERVPYSEVDELIVLKLSVLESRDTHSREATK